MIVWPITRGALTVTSRQNEMLRTT